MSPGVAVGPIALQAGPDLLLHGLRLGRRERTVQVLEAFGLERAVLLVGEQGPRVYPPDTPLPPREVPLTHSGLQHGS